MRVHDLAAALETLAAAETSAAPASERFDLPEGHAELVRLIDGERWSDRSPQGLTLLVLEGSGTLGLDDWRSTALGGQLIPVAGGVRVSLHADAGQPLAFLTIQRAVSPAIDGPHDVS